ncbi:MAG TPA: type II toxin-antitoxin system RelE/ParE family toxin [Blastocatellia bacterium]|nr:type II toxin-antitoxin system RelE/ParE family toxin [Blastocatellia bacterium]
MPYKIRIAPEAHKEIKALSGYVRSPALKIIQSLSKDARPSFAKELRGKSTMYRIRLLDKWRIVYQIKDDEKVVVILRVRRKEDIDYDSL